MKRLNTLLRLFLVTLLICIFTTLSLRGQEGRSNMPLIQAMRDGKLDEARRLLRSGVALNVSDNYGETPLERAIRSGYTDFAIALMAAGADPKFRDPGGGTPLIVAAWYRQFEIAKILLLRGVPVNAADVNGETALMAASQTCLDGRIVQLLLDAGADPNLRAADGSTALFWATAGGNAVAAEKLLNAGADPTSKDMYGHTVEDLACGRGEKGHHQICSLVQKAAAAKWRTRANCHSGPQARLKPVSMARRKFSS